MRLTKLISIIMRGRTQSRAGTSSNIIDGQNPGLVGIITVSQRHASTDPTAMEAQLLQLLLDPDTCHADAHSNGFSPGYAEVPLSKGAYAPEKGPSLRQTNNVGTRFVEVGVVHGTAVERRARIAPGEAVGYV